MIKKLKFNEISLKKLNNLWRAFPSTSFYLHKSPRWNPLHFWCSSIPRWNFISRAFLYCIPSSSIVEDYPLSIKTNCFKASSTFSRILSLAFASSRKIFLSVWIIQHIWSQALVIRCLQTSPIALACQPFSYNFSRRTYLTSEFWAERMAVVGQKENRNFSLRKVFMSSQKVFSSTSSEKLHTMLHWAA